MAVSCLEHEWWNLPPDEAQRRIEEARAEGIAGA